MHEEESSRHPAPTYNVEDPHQSDLVDACLQEIVGFPDRDLIREVFVTAFKLADDRCSRGDLKILRTAIKEMRHAFRVFALYRNVPKVSIFGSARVSPEAAEYAAAVELGRKLARHGFMVITGAGGGVMGGGHEGAGRDMSFGLNIMLPFEQEANQIIAADRKLINFRYFFTRKLFFVKESAAIVLMPGGFGTLDEGFETLTLVQTGKSEPAPIIMLDVPGGDYWKQWESFVHGSLLERGFVSAGDRSLYRITDSVEEAFKEIETFYRRYHSSRYVNKRQTLVLRLKEPLAADQVEDLNREFTDFVTEGRIEASSPFPEEEDEPELLSLFRLAFAFDQRHFGRLRQFIDRINRI